MTTNYTTISKSTEQNWSDTTTSDRTNYINNPESDYGTCFSNDISNKQSLEEFEKIDKQLKEKFQKLGELKDAFDNSRHTISENPFEKAELVRKQFYKQDDSPNGIFEDSIFTWGRFLLKEFMPPFHVKTSEVKESKIIVDSLDKIVIEMPLAGKYSSASDAETKYRIVRCNTVFALTAGLNLLAFFAANTVLEKDAAEKLFDMSHNPLGWSVYTPDEVLRILDKHDEESMADKFPPEEKETVEKKSDGVRLVEDNFFRKVKYNNIIDCLLNCISELAKEKIS